MRRLAGPLVVLLLTGCSPAAPADDGRAGPLRAPDTPLHVEVERSRSAAGRGVLEVVLTTSGDEEIEVTSLQLLDPRFEEAPATPKSTTVPADGRRIVTPIPATEARCVDPDPGAIGDARMAVSYTDAAGDVRHVILPIGAAGEAVLAGIAADACRRRAAEAAASVAFGDAWASAGSATATGVLRLERANAAGPLVVEDVQGTVIFSLRVLAGEPGAVLALAPGETRAEVPVEVSAARCDPHALIESKKTYLFPAWLRIGDGPAVFLTVEPEADARRALEALLQEGCFPEQHG